MHSQMGQDSDPCDDGFSRYSQLTRDEAESLAKAEGRIFRTVWPGSLWVPLLCARPTTPSPVPA